MRTRMLFYLLLMFAISVSIQASPWWGEIQSFSQPDGTTVKVALYGDETYIRCEALNGYTVIRDETSGWFCYATLSADSSTLVSTGIHYTDEVVVPSVSKSIAPHIDMSKSAFQKIRNENRQLLKKDISEKSYTTKSNPVTGNVKGLVIIVDFSDQPATLPVSEYDSLWNGANYTNYGMFSSIKKYYSDISGGMLVLDNVVFGIYRAPKTFAQYDSMPWTAGAQEILNLALKWIGSKGFNFSTLTTSGGIIKAINLMYTGSPRSTTGMWYHSGNYSGFSANGVISGSYCCSKATTPLTISSSCHELGHMICGWVDTYKLNNTTGPNGIGNFDIMCSPGSTTNPVTPNPFYIKEAGWAKIIDVTGFNGTKSDIAGNQTYYQYTNPVNSKEYYLFKNYYKTGHCQYVPDEGLTIWHIDEAGDNQTTHFQVYLEHANNDITDHTGACWHAGGETEFSDTTTPNAKWYNGSNSNLRCWNISAPGASMTYQFGVSATNVDKLETATSEITIYPNPTSDYINILSNNISAAEITIVNLAGQVVFYNKSFTLKRINVSEWVDGVYNVQVTIGNNTTRQKVVVMR